MEQKEIETRVYGVVSEVMRVPREKMTLESRFREDLGADSLDLATLLMALEDEFRGEISQEQEKLLVSIGATVNFLSSKQSEAVLAS